MDNTCSGGKSVSGSPFHKFDVIVTDRGLRAYHYHVVSSLGPNKAVFMAAVSHAARYYAKYPGEFECESVEVADIGPTFGPEAGDLADPAEWPD